MSGPTGRSTFVWSSSPLGCLGFRARPGSRRFRTRGNGHGDQLWGVGSRTNRLVRARCFSAARYEPQSVVSQ
jgi:hypothetical protein